MNAGLSVAPTREPLLSVVVPVHNEAAHVAPLYAEIRGVLDAIRTPWELVFINDGSNDDTLAQLEAIHAADTRVRIIDLDGNFGEAAALSAGFHRARGEIVVTLDGDGQNDPADIPRLLDALERPHVLVASGRRVDRHAGHWLGVVPSRVANALIARATGVPVHDCGCGLKAYKRAALGRIHLPRGANRFLPAILRLPGHTVVEVDTRDRPRRHGRSHYGIGRTLVVLRDLLALPFLLGDPRRAEIAFGLSTAGWAGLAAIAMDRNPALTVVLDALAVGCGLVWWNVRRFNRIQVAGAYQVRREYP